MSKLSSNQNRNHYFFKIYAYLKSGWTERGGNLSAGQLHIWEGKSPEPLDILEKYLLRNTSAQKEYIKMEKVRTMSGLFVGANR